MDRATKLMQDRANMSAMLVPLRPGHWREEVGPPQLAAYFFQTGAQRPRNQGEITNILSSISSFALGPGGCRDATCYRFRGFRAIVASAGSAHRSGGRCGSESLCLVLNLPAAVNDRAWDLKGELAGLCCGHQRRT